MDRALCQQLRVRDAFPLLLLSRGQRCVKFGLLRFGFLDLCERGFKPRLSLGCLLAGSFELRLEFGRLLAGSSAAANCCFTPVSLFGLNPSADNWATRSS